VTKPVRSNIRRRVKARRKKTEPRQAHRPTAGRQTAAHRAKPPNPPRHSPKFVAPYNREVIIIKPPLLCVNSRATQAEAVQDHCRFDGTGRFCQCDQAIDEKIASSSARNTVSGLSGKTRARRRRGPCTDKKIELDVEDKLEQLKPRAPVVTIMATLTTAKRRCSM